MDSVLLALPLCMYVSICMYISIPKLCVCVCVCVCVMRDVFCGDCGWVCVCLRVFLYIFIYINNLKSEP